MVRPWRVLGKASFYFLPDVMFHKESVISGLQGCCQSRQLSRWAHTCIVQLVAEVGVFHAIYGQSALATKVTATRFLVQQPPATTHQLNNKHISLATSGYHGVTDWSLRLCDWGLGINESNGQQSQQLLKCLGNIRFYRAVAMWPTSLFRPVWLGSKWC